MKKIKWIIAVLAALMVLTGCTSEEPQKIPETGAADTGTVSGAVLYGKEDREILDAYTAIVPEGVHDVKILFLTAGKADSILVMIDDTVSLIDTGILASPSRLIPAMEQLGAEKIDHLILTHTHNDHIGGYEYLSQIFEIGSLHTSSISMNLGLLDNLVSGEAHYRHDPGDVISVTDGVWFEVLGPIEYNQSDDNDNSLVLRLAVNDTVVIFAADMKYADDRGL